MKCSEIDMTTSCIEDQSVFKEPIAATAIAVDTQMAEQKEEQNPVENQSVLYEPDINQIVEAITQA